MYRIGIYLALEPHVGGSYQYWYSVIQALTSFDRSQFDIYGIYEDDKWRDILDHNGVKGVKLLFNENKSVVYHWIEKIYWKLNSELLFDMLSGFSYSRKSIRTLRKLKLDIILSDSTVLAKHVHTRSMIPIHDLMHRYEREIPEMIDGYEYREKMYKREIKKADAILVDSELGKNHVIECYGAIKQYLDKHIEVLPFIPPSYIYEYDESYKTDLDIPDKYFFYPAQFWSHKNHLRLIEAVKKLKDEGLFIYFVFCGAKKNEYARIMDKISELDLGDQITTMGYVDNNDMVYLYRHARALIYPTLFGPTNIPPLEAFNLGCPVGASKIYAMPEQLGDAAILFNPRNVEEIVDTMRRLWEDDALCSDLITKGYKRASEWGRAQFADRLESIIETTLRK